jgi:hypothetical protein
VPKELQVFAALLLLVSKKLFYDELKSFIITKKHPFDKGGQ